MRYSVFALLILATASLIGCTGCTGERGGSNQSMSASGMRSAPYDSSPGRGVEDPRG
jgi:hypothetical protein